MAITFEEVFDATLKQTMRAAQAEQQVKQLQAKVDELEKKLEITKVIVKE